MKKYILFTCLATSSVSAQTAISYTNAIPGSMTDWTNSVSITRFNPTLGALQSMSVALASQISTVDFATNATVAAPSHGYLETVFSINADDSCNLFGNGSGDVSLDSYTGAIFRYSLAAGVGTNSPAINASDTVFNTGITDGSTLAGFTGSSPVNYVFWTDTSTLANNTGGNTTMGEASTAATQLVVTYEFTPAPTPEPAGLLLSGLAMLFPFRNWRRRRA